MSGSPYYRMVPKEPRANVAFRRAVAERGIRDPAFAAEQVRMCREDVLYYLNVFVFIYEPRPGLYWPGTCVPMITWKYQDEHILRIAEAYGRRDMVCEKSREMSGTWNHLVVLDWRWRFYEGEAQLLVSRDKEMVDRAGDGDALFQKLDYIQKRMPPWMPPGSDNIRRVDMVRENMLNGSSQTGEATTADVGVGGRKTAVFCDEVARWKRGLEMMEALRGVTNCRLMCSTHKGIQNAFAEAVRKAKSGEMEYHALHWSLHPHKAAGLWRDARGKLRSPWYEAECRKCFSKAEVAAELDMDPYGSETMFFDPDMLDELRRTTARDPEICGSVGEMEFDSQSLAFRGFTPRDRGRWRLWCKLDAQGRPPRMNRQYVAGVDVSSGTGATNSVLVVSDCATREKVAEFTTPFLRPDEFADYAVAACEWFSGHAMGVANTMFLVWEANGPGRIFGSRVADLGYGNIYMRETEDRVSRRKTESPGWWNTGGGPRSTLTVLLGELRSALARGHYIERSEYCLDEYRSYVHGEDGSVVCRADPSLASRDPSGAGENHADIVIATALSYRGMQSMGESQQGGESRVAPEGSLAHRMKIAERENAPPLDDWGVEEEWSCEDAWVA